MVLNSLSLFQKQAKDYLNEHRNAIVVNFENNTYKVKIPSDEAPEGFWSSTLIFDQDQCTFASCDCFDCDEDYCEHLTIALLAILERISCKPLHVKFQQSFWYHLFYQCFLDGLNWQRTDVDTFALKSSLVSITTTVLSCQLSTLFLSDSDQGKQAQTFVQSTMYQLAKRLFLACEHGAILHVNQDAHSNPAIFLLENEQISFRAEILDTTFLARLFSTIDFASSSLCPQNLSFNVSSAYVDIDQASICFEYTPCLPTHLLQYAQTAIGGIQYIPALNQVIIPTKTFIIPIAALFLLPTQIQRHLSNLCDIDVPQTIRYTIEHLRDASFSFSAYLKQPGDLQGALFFAPHYCYIPGGKLISIQNFLSKELSFVVKANEMGDFLNTYGDQIQEEGFRAYKDTRPNIQLNYNITPEGVLFFDYETGVRYDDWIYYPQKGFFLHTRDPLSIQDGLNVKPEDIPSFIFSNETILRQVPHFFAPHAPLKNIVFHVHPTQENGLQLTPIFEGLEGENCRLFGPFLYREHIGFNLLPNHLHSLSTIPLTVDSSDVPNFISKYTQHDHVIFTEPEIRSPKTLGLTVLSIQRPFPSSPLHLELELHTNIGSLPLGALLKQLAHKTPFLFSKAGFLNFQLYFFQLLRSFITNEHCIIEKNTLIVSVTDIFKLDALAPLSLAANVQANPEDLNFFEQLKVLCLPSIPHELFSTNHNLRPYQSTGLLWLWFLYNYRLSGLLCDEMGLGKTHQATALLDIVYQSTRQAEEKATFLVVSPASVLPHWEQILTAHLSKDVRIFAFHGVNKPKELPPYDIVITSYGTLRQKQHLFLNKTFTIAVFDEMHVAKNKTSQIHKILARLDAQMKVGLTGTPVENNLLEFKGLLDIILPNYLPSDSAFKKMFAQKQEIKPKEDGPGPHDMLIKMTRPFILRRTKKTVLPELPDKVESIIHCSLSSEQEQLYLATLQREKGHIQQLSNVENNQVNYLHIFALLNHLKQICDHPAVFFKQPEQYHKHSSGKWEAFKQLLHDSLNSGYKVVVFSQYVHMIHIISLYLEEQGIKYASIQGKSIKRKEEIDKFTHDPDCRVFIGSLLAAGTGINLTAGNVVIMYDRWWNPAKENQALDRAHRIGQKRTVFVYKFITEATLEERIQYLITKKTQLLNEAITSQDADILHTFNAEDLKTILSYQDELCEESLNS